MFHSNIEQICSKQLEENCYQIDCCLDYHLEVSQVVSMFELQSIWLGAWEVMSQIWVGALMLSLRFELSLKELKLKVEW